MYQIEFLDKDNLHKKFGSDISKIVDVFNCLTFGSHFLAFQWNQKQRNNHQNLGNRKKSTIFEISHLILSISKKL